MERRTFRSYDQNQNLLLPPSLREWLPKGHLAFFISDVVSGLDLSELISDYSSPEGKGAPPYDPRMLLKVLIYGYATGVFSSRKLAQKCIEDVAFRYLAAQQEPDFRTLIKFRSRHRKRFRAIFVQVVELAREMKLVRLGHLSIDGTKVRANANKHKAMSYSRMLEQERQLQGEPPKRYRKSPEDKPKAGEQDNFTDPDSRIMMDGATKGFVQAYNCQVAVDAQAQIIVGADLGNNAADVGKLLGMVDQVEANLGQYAKKVTADGGYKSEDNFAGLEERGVNGYIACGREVYDQRVQAPRGRIGKDATRTERMARKLLTKRGRAVYRKRKYTCEPVIGWIKAVLGFCQFSMRGLDKVSAEWKLVCTAINLRRMAVLY